MIINHDFHIHTNLSLCAKPEATLDMYIQRCKELGIKKMAITNHMWDHSVQDWHVFYDVQTPEYIYSLKEQIKQADKSGVNILFGCESEYSFEHRRPAITPAVAEQMDVLLVPNSHTHITMPKTFYEPYRKHAEYMIDAFMDIVNSDVANYITAIPHPFMAVCCPYSNRLLLDEITDDEFKHCFSAAAEKGIALEINPNFIRKKTLSKVYDDPIFRMYRIGKECGCKFTVGTDAHSSAGYDNFNLIYIITSILDLKKDDFHNLIKE